MIIKKNIENNNLKNNIKFIKYFNFIIIIIIYLLFIIIFKLFNKIKRKKLIILYNINIYIQDLRK